MGRADKMHRAVHPFRLILALVCVLLLTVLGTVQVAHAHADGTNIHANCSLCAAAHITVHFAQTPAPSLAAALVAMLEARPQSILRRGVSTFALFTRPPPVDIVPA